MKPDCLLDLDVSKYPLTITKSSLQPFGVGCPVQTGGRLKHLFSTKTVSRCGYTNEKHDESTLLSSQRINVASCLPGVSDFVNI